MTPDETVLSLLAAPTRGAGGRSDLTDDRRLERDLAAAVRDGSFVLHFQPRLRLATRQVVGAEALIRWPHRKRGLLPPAGFIPLAERSGQIEPIGAWVLRTACAEALRWPDLWTVSVNVSARQVADGSLLRQLGVALQNSPLPPERLELELTEALLQTVDLDMLLTLSVIRDLGIGVALDDFGAGAAGLSMLKRLPLTAVKLDRGLLRDLPASTEDATIARAVIDTGRVLGLTVVAEGIETPEQYDFLCDAGCDEGQGFYFGRAVPAADLLP